MRIVTIRRLAYVVVGLAAVALRWTFVEFVSGDFTAFLSMPVAAVSALAAGVAATWLLVVDLPASGRAEAVS